MCLILPYNKQCFAFIFPIEIISVRWSCLSNPCYPVLNSPIGASLWGQLYFYSCAVLFGLFTVIADQDAWFHSVYKCQIWKNICFEYLGYLSSPSYGRTSCIGHSLYLHISQVSEAHQTEPNNQISWLWTKVGVKVCIFLCYNLIRLHVYSLLMFLFRFASVTFRENSPKVLSVSDYTRDGI